MNVKHCPKPGTETAGSAHAGRTRRSGLEANVTAVFALKPVLDLPRNLNDMHQVN
jgi:hypothetical protein